MYYPSSENKGADQLRSYCAADLRLLFSHMQKIGFSHVAAHIIINNGKMSMPKVQLNLKKEHQSGEYVKLRAFSLIFHESLRSHNLSEKLGIYIYMVGGMVDKILKKYIKICKLYVYSQRYSPY